MPGTAKMRVARPTDNLDAVARFYTQGLGLAELYRFENHAGFDGVMLGTPDAPYHLEFTRAHGHRAGRAPTADNLLVFYLPDEREWNDAVARMIEACREGPFGARVSGVAISDANDDGSVGFRSKPTV